MNGLLHPFTKKHAFILLGLYVPFGLLILLSMINGRESSPGKILTLPVLGLIMGPFTGAVIRNLQSCCWSFSCSIAPYFALFLAGGLIPQFFSQLKSSLRLALWAIGWLGWFVGIIVSFLHALS
jgi:hypothetical protein